MVDWGLPANNFADRLDGRELRIVNMRLRCVRLGVGIATMKWSVGNVLGAGSWISGLYLAKGASLPTGNIFTAPDHHFLTGLLVGGAGLATMLWVNLRSAA